MTSPALFATIWVALVLFVAGEFGKRPRESFRPKTETPVALFEAETGVSVFIRNDSRGLSWWSRGLFWASASGLVIATAHIIIALAINDDWNHAVAWRVTEDRTREMFGFGWGGAVAANYAFLMYWAVDLWRWRTNPAGLAQQPALVKWASRGFVLGIIVPAAIVFASGPRRGLGVLVVIGLLWAWRGHDRAQERAS